MAGSHSGVRTMGKTNRVLWLGALAAISLVAVGMAATNPDPFKYEQYAAARLSIYLEDQLCADLPAFLAQVLQEQCSVLLKQNQSAFQEIIRNHTQRQNFVLFSRYSTTLALPGTGLLPTYQVDSLGAFNRFFTYRAVQH
ncbi:MAG: DUF4359 domain-containing protein [Cyanobacteria bacterium Co-bin8]|nr:DUF4359 domain-containing protein [Cyanobacteria bacterium Co-bin8]